MGPGASSPSISRGHKDIVLHCTHKRIYCAFQAQINTREQLIRSGFKASAGMVFCFGAWD